MFTGFTCDTCSPLDCCYVYNIPIVSADFGSSIDQKPPLQPLSERASGFCYSRFMPGFSVHISFDMKDTGKLSIE